MLAAKLKKPITERFRLKAFIQEIIPIEKNKKDNLPPSEKLEQEDNGWNYCLVGHCGKKRSATLLMTKAAILEHMKDHGWTTEKMVQAETKQISIKIIYKKTETSKSDTDKSLEPPEKKGKMETILDPESPPPEENKEEPAKDEIMNPVVRLALNSLWNAESHEEPDGFKRHPSQVFVCLLDSDTDSEFEESTSGHSEKSRDDEEPHEIFNIHFRYRELTDIGEKEMSLMCVKCGCEYIIQRTKNYITDGNAKLSEDGFRCHLCERSLLLLLQDEIKSLGSCHDKSGNPKICPICEEILDYRQHLKDIHKIIESSQGFECFVCEVQLASEDEVKLHISMIRHASNIKSYV